MPETSTNDSPGTREFERYFDQREIVIEMRATTLFRKSGPVGALMVLTFGGYIKGAPVISSSPVDITLAAAAILLSVCVLWLASNLRDKFHGAVPIFILWSTFLFGVILVSPNSYSTDKAMLIFTISLLAVMGSMIVLRSESARFTWLLMQAAMGVLVVGLALIFPSVDDYGRLALEGGATIGTGRATGAAVVVLFTFALVKSRFRWLLAICALTISAALIATASRGPVLAALVAVLIVAGVAARKGRISRLFWVVGFTAIAGYVAWSLGLVSDRLLSTTDDSAEARPLLWAETLGLIPYNPMGIGWGNLFHYLPPSVRLDSGNVQYPHNILLEVASESGWLAGIALLVILWIAFERQRRAAIGAVEMAMLGLLVFHIANALVSGDVNDNRGVWVSLGAALTVPSTRPRGPDVQMQPPSEMNSFRRPSLPKTDKTAI